MPSKINNTEKLICVLCGTEWGMFHNVCQNNNCKGFSTWGLAPMKPESFTIDENGKWHLNPLPNNIEK